MLFYILRTSSTPLMRCLRALPSPPLRAPLQSQAQNPQQHSLDCSVLMAASTSIASSCCSCSCSRS